MKKNKTIAAVLFGLLAIVQFFGLSFVTVSASAQLPMFIYLEVAALVAYIIACTKMFATADVSVTSGGKRSAAALAVIYLVAIAMNIGLSTNLLALSLAPYSQELAQNPTTGIVIICIRTALLIAAMYFTIANEKQAVAVIEFDGGVDAADLTTQDAVETITEKLDAVEE